MTRGKEVTTQRNNMPEFAAWVNAMELEATIADESDSDFDSASILQDIMAADSFDKAVELQKTSMQSGKTLVDQIHTIIDFTLRKSDNKYEGLGVFAVVKAADETGQEFTYGVGAANVLAILWKAREFGRIPGKFVIKSRETRNGELLSLMPVKVAVQA